MLGSCETSLMWRALDETGATFVHKICFENPIKASVDKAKNNEVFCYIGEFERSDVDAAKFLTVSFDWFKNVQKKTVLRVTYSGKAKAYWNEEENNEVQSVFALDQIYWEKTASTMKCGAL